MVDVLLSTRRKGKNQGSSILSPHIQLRASEIRQQSAPPHPRQATSHRLIPTRVPSAETLISGSDPTFDSIAGWPSPATSSCLLLTLLEKLKLFSPTLRQPNTSIKMPSEVSDIKQFIEICRRKDASCTCWSSGESWGSW